jgi:GNAT superfamily N-acetyltransferase
MAAMPGITIQPFAYDHIEPAAGLLAARHRAARHFVPHLTPALDEPAAFVERLAKYATNPRAHGRAALRDGRLVGFLFGEEELVAPDSFAAQWVPPQTIAISLDGHCVAGGEDALAVYRALYADLAEAWVGWGYFTHRVGVFDCDAEVQHAWMVLGFGRHSTAATRHTGPVDTSSRPLAAIEVHRAGPEDIEVVMRLTDELNRHHASSPMFWPIVRTAQPAGRAIVVEALEKGETPFFVAYRDGAPLGMQTFLRPGWTPSLIDRAHDVYLFEGVVSREARAGGVGTALLAHSMTWAREAGYATCTLHFAAANPSGAPFWLGHGFVPLEHGMERRIDQRIAWSR